ncbi:sodium-dependent phosphate transporter 1-A-like [Ruditapes philippinarum]|uniref:sodium-dependent phosphate transporter 1-A-like n=1 Tax=Ruditapes philippinarum TaxID=129788 RepID=UPI00295B91EB|nr:sodium-dependent phosphate transporter 1-A-like [Ruditapes philippinarum]
MVLYDDTWLWLVILGFIIAFVLAFGLGANDVANAFGTSVGAKVLTIRQACILGTIFEIMGAILVGAKVSNTIRKGIISPDIYTNGTEDVFMAGNVAALTGSCIWLMVATLFGLPVSGTHSIVGATLGFSMVVNGVKGIGWIKLAMIAASWFISPLLSGIVSALLFKLLDVLVLSKEKPLEYGLRLLPVFYALTLAVNLFSVFYKGSELLHFNKIPLYGTLILTFVPPIIIAILVKIFLVPRQRKKIQDRCKKLLQEEGTSDTITPHITKLEER